MDPHSSLNDPAFEPMSETTPDRLKRAGLITGIWLMVGLLSASQFYIATRSMGHHISYLAVLLWEIPAWLYWSPATFVVIWLAGAFRLEKRRLAASLTVHIAAAAALALGYILFWMTWNQAVSPYSLSDRPFAEMLWTYFRTRFTIAFILYWAIYGCYQAWSGYRHLRQRELETARLKRSLAEARLQALRSQLQPHFLFNALHSVSSLMDEDISGARRMLSRLSELLRLTLREDDGDEIPLRRELGLLRRYLEIEHIRFQDRLSVSYRIENESLDARVPVLLLQPLVENAIRHGITPGDSMARITVSARRVDGSTEISVEDEGVGLSEPEAERAWNREANGGGLGLANTRARLRELYGERAQLELEERPGGGLRVRIRIPYRVLEAKADV